MTLFCNFLEQDHPADLVINAVSLNFLGNIDNAFVSCETRSLTGELFKELVEKGPPPVSFPRMQKMFIEIVHRLLFTIRVLGTCAGGCILAIIFVSSKEE